MIVLAVLFLSMLIFRGIGAAGVSVFATWTASARDALAVMLVFTGITHFNKMRHSLVRMVPPAFPAPMTIIYVTGILELLGAVGLVIPQTRPIAGICLAILFIAMFPANWYAVRNAIPVAGRPATPLWVRLPMQILFIFLALSSARST